FGRLEPQFTRPRAEGLWRAAARLEVSVNLVDLFPIIVDTGATITPVAQQAIDVLLPELAGLKRLLDQLALWPVGPRSSIAPPAGVSFPLDEYGRVTSTIRTVVIRDAWTLDQVGAVKQPQTSRGRPYAETLSFPLHDLASSSQIPRARAGEHTTRFGI